MNRMILAWIGGVIALGVLLANIFFIVDQRKEALVVRLGQPVRVINAPADYDPGLKMKWPMTEDVVFFDKRNQLVEVPNEGVITGDDQQLMVDAFVRYRINDPLQYYRTLHDEAAAKDRLEPLITSSLRQVLGASKLSEIISIRRDAVMAQTLADVRRRAALSRFGIEVIDLRIRRTDLPSNNQQAAFTRMQTAMQQQAAQNRAIGEQQKRTIVAEADKDVTVTIAQATEQAGVLQGEGDAQAAQIFAQSFGRDPAFAAFFRSMAAYESAFGAGDTTMVLSPDSDFFKYFKNGPNAH